MSMAGTVHFLVFYNTAGHPNPLVICCPLFGGGLNRHFAKPYTLRYKQRRLTSSHKAKCYHVTEQSHFKMKQPFIRLLLSDFGMSDSQGRPYSMKQPILFKQHTVGVAGVSLPKSIQPGVKQGSRSEQRSEQRS